MEIITNGLYEKKRGKCKECGTVFAYRLLDYEMVKDDKGDYVYHILKCPSCGCVFDTKKATWLEAFISALKYVERMEEEKNNNTTNKNTNNKK